MTDTEPKRCGVIAVVGHPNAGKSTLVNQMVGTKVAIVTHKVQTTRTRLRGIFQHGPAQIILVDTPGIFAPRRKLDEAMVEAAWGGADDADEVLLLVDAPRHAEEDGGGKAGEDTARIVEGLKARGRKVILVLNKIDEMRREPLLELIAKFNETGAFKETFLISALSGEGVEELKAYIAERAPEGPWLYPEDQPADVTQRLLASEVTREKLILRLHDELPYATTVETETWKDLRDGSVRIEQVIFVERDSQKAIVLGKGGRTIKDIGKDAREELQEMLDRKVHLFLFVKVRERWSEDPERFRLMGLELPKG
jgi:GTP-binding protein Era